MTKKFLKKSALFLTAATMLSATAVFAKDDRATQLKNLAHYEAAAGAPQQSFTHMLRSGVSWQPLGPMNLLYHTSPANAYLLKLDQECMDMDFAQSVTVGRGGNTIHVNTDRVKVLGPTNPGGFDCKITEIRKVDLKKYRAIRDAAKASQQ